MILLAIAILLSFIVALVVMQMVRIGGPAYGLVLVLTQLVYILLFFIVARITTKFVVFLLDRKYADTLCVMQSISVVVELSQDDILIHPGRRQSMINRINHLSRCIRFLPLRFNNTDKLGQLWLSDYFSKVDMYVRERERWAIVPVGTTLHDLRTDFYQLAKIFSVSRYGDLPLAPLAPKPQSPSRSRAQRISTAILRFLGIMTPALILGLLLLDPSRMATLGLTVQR